MEYKKYQHIEKWGSSEVDGIEFGECYIFSKIDGTNGQVFLDDNKNICCGSRNRQLSLDNDNQGFMRYILSQENIKDYLNDHHNHRLFGEWLKPHSLKTYRDTAWNKFYIFDIMQEIDECENYINYDEYQSILEKYRLDYIPCFSKIKNPKVENFYKLLDINTFLIKEGLGFGEGIVIKNYDYVNKYGRKVWAKIVTQEFKDKHVKIMGPSVIKSKTEIEDRIIEDFCTDHLIDKIYWKIRNENNDWSSKYIPRLLNTVYHDLVIEEIWNICKKYKNPKIDFKLLQKLINQKIKEVKKELF